MILAADGIEVTAEAADGAEAVAAVRRTRPDVVLMDIRMPQMDGIEATRRILGSGPRETRRMPGGEGPQETWRSLGGGRPQEVPRSLGGDGSRETLRMPGGEGPQETWRSLGGGRPQEVPRSPGGDGSRETPRMLGGDGPQETRVIILTTYDLDHYVYAALTAGASGFLLKDVSPEHLVAALRLVRSGDALLAPTITRRLIERFAGHDEPRTDAPHRDLSALTTRELEVLRLLATGLSNAELATRLSLSPTTIKTHVGRILSKLDLRDRVQAVVLAYETGLIAPGGSAPSTAK
ncbi:response regulator transcription factor [Streptomyces sp. AN091965]|nr:response regulator transcription factor [Streptomyces sp. AN091965]